MLGKFLFETSNLIMQLLIDGCSLCGIIVHTKFVCVVLSIINSLTIVPDYMSN